jgi:hypothetical protein
VSRLLRLGFCLALATAAAGCGDEPPGPHLSSEAQSRLPLELSLGNLCPGAETPPELERQLRREAKALLVELEEHPDWRVRYTFHTEELGPVEESITVTELAEIQLEDLRAGSSASGECSPELQKRLADALS